MLRFAFKVRGSARSFIHVTSDGAAVEDMPAVSAMLFESL
jgi:hypothetical protein